MEGSAEALPLPGQSVDAVLCGQPAMDQAERARTLATIREILHRQPETSAGEFTLPPGSFLPVTLRPRQWWSSGGRDWGP